MIVACSRFTDNLTGTTILGAFDMNGNRRRAKRAGGCPLDGGVRSHLGTSLEVHGEVPTNLLFDKFLEYSLVLSEVFKDGISVW